MAKEYNQYREQLILDAMKVFKRPVTVNEIIEFIWQRDKKLHFKRGWRFYVHLNKFPAPMSRKKLISFTGEYKLGATGIQEKLWELN